MLVSEARRQLQEATSIHEVKTIRDKAAAVKLYLQQAGEGLEAQNAAAEIKLRAERRAGELLSSVEKNGGGRPSGNRSHAATSFPTLDEIGITKSQSSRWQAEASIPEDAFDEHVESFKAAGKELTSTSVLKLARQQTSMNGDDHRMAEALATARDIEAREERASELLSAFGGIPFGTIYADPPWCYDNKATRANVAGEYANTMTIDEICDMPVGDMAADDAHLHLWTTVAFHREAHRVIEAWGFEFKSMFVWCKTQIGIGNYWRLAHELLFTAVRGDAKRFNDKSLKSWAEFPRGEHSAKPEEVRGMIERASPGPYLELFGRKEVPGWKVFGNQIDRQRRLV